MEVGPAAAAVAMDMVMSLPGEKDGKSREGVDLPASGRIVTPNLKMFTFSELERATRNFKPATVLGEGGFGRVFKGWIDPKTLAPSKVGVGMAVAVKKSNPDSEQGLREWQVQFNSYSTSTILILYARLICLHIFRHIISGLVSCLSFLFSPF